MLCPIPARVGTGGLAFAEPRAHGEFTCEDRFDRLLSVAVCVRFFSPTLAKAYKAAGAHAETVDALRQLAKANRQVCGLFCRIAQSLPSSCLWHLDELFVCMLERSLARARVCVSTSFVVVCVCV